MWKKNPNFQGRLNLKIYTVYYFIRYKEFRDLEVKIDQEFERLCEVGNH